MVVPAHNLVRSRALFAHAQYIQHAVDYMEDDDVIAVITSE